MLQQTSYSASGSTPPPECGYTAGRHSLATYCQNKSTYISSLPTLLEIKLEHSLGMLIARVSQCGIYLP